MHPVLQLIDFDVFCQHVADGGTWRQFCQTYGLGFSALHDWIYSPDHPERAERYARAKEARAEAQVDEINRLSTGADRDLTYVDANGVRKVDPGAVNLLRLEVDTKKWTASKTLPKQYGERIELAGKVVTEHTVALTDEQRALLGTMFGNL